MADRRLVWPLVVLTLLCLPAGIVGAERRPLVVVFAASYTSPMLGAINTGAEEKAEINLSLLGMRAVRDRLAERGVVEVLAYQPEKVTDNPSWARAFAEAKVIVSAQEPTEADRRALAKALGAQYLLTIQAEREKEGGVLLEAQAVTVGSGKIWTDRARASTGQRTLRSAPAIQKPYGDDVLSAANTLVLRFLAGPLGETTRAVRQSPKLAPAPAADNAAAVRSPEDEMRRVLAGGDALLASGDTSGAIVAFRRAVNLAPRQAAPRVALTRAYLAAGLGTEAVSEAQRALPLVPRTDDAGHMELTRLLAEGHKRAGDTTAALALYTQIVDARPQTAWARLALGDLLVRENKVDEAEAQYRAVLKREPTNALVPDRLARLRVARGDFAGAVDELAGLATAKRYPIVRDLFDTGAMALTASLTRARRAFDEKQIAREAFHLAVTAQAARASALLTLLKSAEPAQRSGAIHRAYRRRVFAASLLVQASASVLTFIETDERETGGRAALLLNEARQEIAEAQAAEKAADRAVEKADNRGIVGGPTK